MIRSDLNVEVRSEAGKGAARRLRSEGKVPAIFYGPHMKTPTLLTFNAKRVFGDHA